MKEKVALVVVAHPDDEVLGMGGTILKLQKELGYKVHVVFMTTTKPNKKWDYVEKVSKILGTSWRRPYYSGTGDIFSPLRLDGEPISNLVSYIEEAIEELKPEVLFTHHSGDNHQDHRAVAEAVMIATRTYPGQVVKRVYTFDTPSSTEWGFGEFKSFEPNVFIDVSDYFSMKTKALSIYKEEIVDLDKSHARSIENVEMSNRVKGSVVGLNRAETFRLIRSINVL